MSRHEFTAGALPTKQTAHLQWIIINLFACLFTSPASAGAGGGGWGWLHCASVFTQQAAEHKNVQRVGKTALISWQLQFTGPVSSM